LPDGVPAHNERGQPFTGKEVVRHRADEIEVVS
jgi:hypothetical protein